MGRFITEEAYDEYQALKEQMQRLLNKVNVVTAYHRHGQPVPTKALTELANRQIEVEEALRNEKPVQTNEHHEASKNTEGGASVT